MDLSLKRRALISQRLIPREVGRPAGWHRMEIMLNSPLIQDLIFKGEVAKIKEVMSRSTRLGMKTFDQSLFELYETASSPTRMPCATRIPERLRLEYQAREQARVEGNRRWRCAADRRRRCRPVVVKRAGNGTQHRAGERPSHRRNRGRARSDAGRTTPATLSPGTASTPPVIRPSRVPGRGTREAGGDGEWTGRGSGRARMDGG